jgi:hypothetical protein
MKRLVVLVLVGLALAPAAPAAAGDWRAAGDRLAHRVWNSAQREYPFSSEPMPPIYWTDTVGGKGTSGAGAWAVVWPGNGGTAIASGPDGLLPLADRGVLMNESFARLLVGRGSSLLVNWARVMLVHEWTHDYQRADVLAGARWLREGGAQRFAEMVAPRIYGRLGLRVRPLRDTYDRFARRVEREFGRAWILREQFNREEAR